MKVAVTGASGFVGLNLVSLLHQAGHQVRALDHIPSPYWPKDVEYHPVDVLEASTLRPALDGTEVVYHLAARITLLERDDLAWRLNTEGAKNTAEAALACGVRRYVHCSSVHAFNQFGPPIIDEITQRSTAAELPLYDRSKHAGELEVIKVIDQGLDAVIVNPSGLIGPVDYGPSRINGVLLDAARGRVPVVVAGGFDWADVRDVASGMISAASHGRTGENYLLGGHFLTLLELTRMAARAAGRRGPAGALALGLVEPILPLIERISKRFGSDVVSVASVGAIASTPQVNSSRAEQELGYRTRPIEETVTDLVAFFVSSGMLQRP